MRAGDTFYLKVEEAHLFIVVSGPCAHGKVLLIRVTSDPGHIDHTCRLDSSDHSSLEHDSYVHFGDAEIGDAAALDLARDRKLLDSKERVSEATLQRIIDGFSASEHAKPRYQDFAEGHCSCDKRR